MQQSKIVIVGASHGGHESAIELLDKYDDVDVTIFEAGNFVSFMSCGMELFLENQVTAQNDVRNFRPEEITEKGGHVYNNSLVTSIDTDNQQVTVKNTQDQTTQQVAYDKLILSSGVTPHALNVPGSNLENVDDMRGYDWATKLKAAIDNEQVKNVVVIGAGYIGIEATEAFTKAGKNVTLMDVTPKPLMTYLNDEMADLITKTLVDHGVNVKMGVSVTGFEGNGSVTAVTTADETVPADLVICATGVTPATDWLKGTVALDSRGFIETDAYLHTNIKNVSAIGDAIKPFDIPANQPMPVALATTARREAQYVVNHLFEKRPSRPFKGIVGASALSVFDQHFATAGLNAVTAKKANVASTTSFYEDRLRPAYIPDQDNAKVCVSLTYAPESHQILGGAVMSTYDITAQGNVLALAVAQRMTIEDLAEADFFFQPGFDRQWSLLNLAAQNALGNARF